jgi:DNA/RNA-binding domain of Phe-tRNA-synthetase-like protein
MLQVDSHPSLDLAVLEVALPRPLMDLASSPQLTDWLRDGAPAPMGSSDVVRTQIRALLRHGGFKPSGRCKPASEYLVKAATKGALTPINLAVDVCNVVSLYSGLPISVVDRELLVPPLRIGLAAPGTRYVFNATGQYLDLGGLLCLEDGRGPCANAVKDAQRTKTHPETRGCLYLFWGSRALAGRTAEAAAWTRQLLEDHDPQIVVHERSWSMGEPRGGDSEAR